MRFAGAARQTSCIPIVPDPQNFMIAYPAPAEAMRDWILAQRAARNIELALCVGDLVDSQTEAQWGNAAATWTPLDDIVPFVKCTGNNPHDYSSDGSSHIIRASTLINDYFDDEDWLTGVYEEGHIENAYHVVNLSGRPVLVLSLEFCPRDAVLAWAQTIVDAHPGTLTIILTHGYLFNDGTLYSNTGQSFEPLAYAPDGNTGSEIEASLVTPNSQVRLVVCGHVPHGVARRVIRRADGTPCLAIKACWQNFPATWAVDYRGFMGLLFLDWANDVIRFETIAPHSSLRPADAVSSESPLASSFILEAAHL